MGTRAGAGSRRLGWPRPGSGGCGGRRGEHAVPGRESTVPVQWPRSAGRCGVGRRVPVNIHPWIGRQHPVAPTLRVQPLVESPAPGTAGPAGSSCGDSRAAHAPRPRAASPRARDRRASAGTPLPAPARSLASTSAAIHRGACRPSAIPTSPPHPAARSGHAVPARPPPRFSDPCRGCPAPRRSAPARNLAAAAARARNRQREHTPLAAPRRPHPR